MPSCSNCGAAAGPAVELLPADGADDLLCAVCFEDGQPAEEAPPEKKRESQATVLVGLGARRRWRVLPHPRGRGLRDPADRRSPRDLAAADEDGPALALPPLLRPTEAAPGAQAIQDALGVLEGKALFDGAEHPVHVRVAEHEGVRSTSISPTPSGGRSRSPRAGWRVTVDPPVRFRARAGCCRCRRRSPAARSRSCAPFLNYGSEDDFRLMIAWLVMALRPTGPYPVLALHGEQGSGKSTAAEMLRMLVDPNEALLRPAPRDERDLVIAGSNGRVIALENLSSIPQWLSDALCRIATGSGFGTRELYTDADEAMFSVQLPIVLNGIVEVVISRRSAGPLDRPHPAADHRVRQSEDDLWREFERGSPATPRRPARCRLGRDVARADGEARAAAADGRLRPLDRGRRPGARLGCRRAPRRLRRNRADANETTLDASPLVAPLRELGEFEGSATDLLAALVEIVGDGAARAKDWPKSPSALSGCPAPPGTQPAPRRPGDRDRVRPRGTHRPPPDPNHPVGMGTQNGVTRVTRVTRKRIG